MAGGKKGEASKKKKGKEKACALVFDDDVEMEEAEAHDLSDPEDPAFTQSEFQVQGNGQQLQRHQRHQGQRQQGQGSQSAELIVLDPASQWFDDGDVTKCVSGVLTGYYRDPWRNYGEVDENTKTHWWNLFKKKCTWALELEDHVQRGFELKMRERLRDMFHTITKRMNDVKPGWLNEEVHKKMMDIVTKDEKFLKRSEQNKKNRRGGSMDKVVQPTHYQGSISALHHAKRMAKKNKGHFPTLHELFLKTHFKDVPGKGLVPANDQAKEIAETYQKKAEEASTQGIKKSSNELYWESVGGRNKKGRVRGLGQSAELYYSNRMGRVSRSSQQYTPSVVSQMQDQMEHRVQALRDEIRSEMETEMQLRIQSEVAEIKRKNKERWDEFMSRFASNDSCSTFQPQHRDPRDDPGSGGAGQGTPAIV